MVLTVSIAVALVAPSSPAAALPEIGALADRLAFLLKRSQLLFAARHVEVLAAHELTEAECALLTLAVESPGTSPRRLGQHLYIDRTTIVSLVDSLEAKGLVSRSRGVNDRRTIAVHPTPTGRRRLRRALAAVERAEAEFLSCLDQKERTGLKLALAHLIRANSTDQP